MAKVFGVFMLVIGFMFFLAGSFTLFRVLIIKKDSIITYGIVKETYNVALSEGGEGKKYLIVFKDLKGDTFELNNENAFTSDNRYSIGDTIPLFYSRSNPKNSRINTFSEKYLSASIFMPIGALLLIVGIWMLTNQGKANAIFKLFGDIEDSL